MAFDQTPTNWVSGWTGDNTTASFPIASIDELSVAEAGTSSGDIRKIWFALCDHVCGQYTTKAAAGDAPTQMDAYKSGSVNVATGNTTYTYTFSFITAATDLDVIDEP